MGAPACEDHVVVVFCDLFSILIMFICKPYSIPAVLFFPLPPQELSEECLRCHFVSPSYQEPEYTVSSCYCVLRYTQRMSASMLTKCTIVQVVMLLSNLEEVGYQSRVSHDFHGGHMTHGHMSVT